MFSAAYPCTLGLKPLLAQPVYGASVSCLSGVSNLLTKRILKTHAKQYSQEVTQTAATTKACAKQESQKQTKTAATTKVKMAQDEVQEFILNDVHMDLSEAADGTENHTADDLQVRMKKIKELMKKFNEQLKEKQVTYTRVRRRAGVRSRN